jgi:hypothetical protein
VQPDSIAAFLHQVCEMCSDFTVQQQRLLERLDRVRSAAIVLARWKIGLENVKSSNAAATAD